MAVKTKPFKVLRIPAKNGEWIDAHISETGNVCIETSGYAEFELDKLIQALGSLSKS